MSLSLFLHIFVLASFAYSASGLSCWAFGNPDDPDTSGKPHKLTCSKTETVCFIVIDGKGKNGTLVQGCDEKAVEEPCGLPDGTGPAYCSTDNCNTKEFLTKTCSSAHQIRASSPSSLFMIYFPGILTIMVTIAGGINQNSPKSTPIV